MWRVCIIALIMFVELYHLSNRNCPREYFSVQECGLVQFELKFSIWECALCVCHRSFIYKGILLTTTQQLYNSGIQKHIFIFSKRDTPTRSLFFCDILSRFEKITKTQVSDWSILFRKKRKNYLDPCLSYSAQNTYSRRCT